LKHHAIIFNELRINPTAWSFPDKRMQNDGFLFLLGRDISTGEIHASGNE
jgi:hypothetical protein